MSTEIRREGQDPAPGCPRDHPGQKNLEMQNRSFQLRDTVATYDSAMVESPEETGDASRMGSTSGLTPRTVYTSQEAGTPP